VLCPLSEIWGGFPTRIHIPNLDATHSCQGQCKAKDSDGNYHIYNTVNRHVRKYRNYTIL